MAHSEAGDPLGGHNMTMCLEGKVALVTGIGRARGERLAQDRAKVVAAIAEEGHRPSVRAFDAIVLDVRSEDAWGRAMAHAEARHGGLDILVNNAGLRRLVNVGSITRLRPHRVQF